VPETGRRPVSLDVAETRGGLLHWTLLGVRPAVAFRHVRPLRTRLAATNTRGRAPRDATPQHTDHLHLFYLSGSMVFNLQEWVRRSARRACRRCVVMFMGARCICRKKCSGNVCKKGNLVLAQLSSA
jgi:hypothetical protein